VKAQRNEDSACGATSISISTTSCAVDRGLDGETRPLGCPRATTSFGEATHCNRRVAAQPGTIAGRDEFAKPVARCSCTNRVHSTGSERGRIEMRDKDSGLVTGTVNLRYSVDYEVGLLQGRIWFGPAGRACPQPRMDNRGAQRG